MTDYHRWCLSAFHNSRDDGAQRQTDRWRDARKCWQEFIDFKVLGFLGSLASVSLQCRYRFKPFWRPVYSQPQRLAAPASKENKLKGKVDLIIKILSSFNHFHGIPNQHDFLFSLERERYFEECLQWKSAGFKTTMHPTEFQCMDKNKKNNNTEIFFKIS